MPVYIVIIKLILLHDGYVDNNDSIINMQNQIFRNNS